MSRMLSVTVEKRQKGSTLSFRQHNCLSLVERQVLLAHDGLLEEHLAAHIDNHAAIFI